MWKDLEAKANEVNAMQILQDRDYDWVWEYARFRFNESVLDMAKAQDRVSGLLKMVLYGFGAFWVLFLYFFKEQGVPLERAFNLPIVLGLAGLCLAAASAIYCLLPLKRLLLYGEEVAIRFINELPENSIEPKVRFGLGLKMCSDFQERATTRKYQCVFAGFILLTVSLGLLFWGFCLWFLLMQPYGHWV